MPAGKPAGVPCAQLTADLCCGLFGDPRRPAVCTSLAPSTEMCRNDAAAAMAWLTALEQTTCPARPAPLALRSAATLVQERA